MKRPPFRRGPFQGAGPGGIDLKASPAGTMSPNEMEVELTAHHNGHRSPDEILPLAHLRQSSSFWKWLCHNIYVFRFGECIAFQSRKT